MMRQVPGARRALLSTGLLLVAAALAACGADAVSVSTDQIKQDAKVVLRADLRPGSTGVTASRIVRQFIDVDGVWGTHGDDGRHVWVMASST